jgi:hypothetical protein
VPSVLAASRPTCATSNGLIIWEIVLLATRSEKGAWACSIGGRPERGAAEWRLRHRQEHSPGRCVSRLIEDRNFLAFTIGVVVNHGVYFTEGIDSGEGLVPSPTSPNRASPELTTVH